MRRRIPYNQHAIGVVVGVFSAKVHPWSPEGELALVAFTDLAALTIANTMQSEERGELASQLRRALDARVVIEQAKGVLVAREGLTEREALSACGVRPAASDAGSLRWPPKSWPPSVIGRKREQVTVYLQTTAPRTLVGAEWRAAARDDPVVDPSPPQRYAICSGWSSRPGQVEQHHDPLGLQDPIGQHSLRSPKGHRPAAITKATPAKDHAGLGGVHPQDRDDASHRAGQQGRCTAEPPVKLLRHKDLVGAF